jgi:hypothetical protein
VRFAFGGLAGTGLICEGELVTFTAFADEPDWSLAGSAVRPAAARRDRAPPPKRISHLRPTFGSVPDLGREWAEATTTVVPDLDAGVMASVTVMSRGKEA